MVAIGKSECVEKLFNFFDKKSGTDSEISLHKVNTNISILSISKSEKFEKVGESIIFFRGWFQDHETKSIIIGQNGFHQWLKKSPDSCLTKGYEGCYFLTTISNGEIIVRNDVFSYLPVIYFSNDDLMVCTDSMYLISKVRKYLNLPCELNKSVMHTRAWTHGLASAVMSNNTQIKGVQLLSPGKHLSIKISKRFLRKNMI